MKPNNPNWSVAQLAGVLQISIAILLVSACSVNADISSARNFYQFEEQQLTSGQPEKAQLLSASAEGIEVVINLVPSTESIFNPDEAAILAAQGVEYFHTPVSWSSPKEDEIMRFIKAMDSVGDRKVLVHCWANARASALVHTHRMIQSTENQTAEYSELKRVWKEVAGYDLDRNDVWKEVIKRFAKERRN